MVSRHERVRPEVHHKRTPGKQEGFLHPIEKVAVPFHMVHIDHLGPFCKSTKGNTHLLVAIDGYTKYTFLVPVKNTSSNPVIKFLIDKMYLFGVPNRIVTDRGSCYTSKSFKAFCEQMGVKHILNAVATSRANGQAERVNGTALKALTTTCKSNPTWDRDIKATQFAINNTIDSPSGRTPSEMLFALRPRAPSDSVLTNAVQEKRPCVDDIKKVQREVEQRIRDDQCKQKERYDSKRKEATSYKQGDLVLIVKQFPSDGKSRKLRLCIVDPSWFTKCCQMTVKRNYDNVIAADKMKPCGGMSEESNDEDAVTEDDALGVE